VSRELPLRSLRMGRAVPYGPRGAPSAIDKQPVAGPVLLTPEGLAGDEQGDRAHHGGRDKALHHYPAEHYPFWRRRFPQEADRFVEGGFGENLSTEGLTEAEVCVGDRFHLGSAIIEISQARQPCWKLNIRFGLPEMARETQESGRTGWYYRVVTPGAVAADDKLLLLSRPHPEWPLDRILRILYRRGVDREGLAALADLEVLAANWRELAARRLARGEVESWRRRLETPHP